MKTIVAVAALALVAAWSTAAWSDEGRKSTEQERADFLKGAEAVEKDPLSEASQTFRAWAIPWMDEVEDIVVNVSGDVVTPWVEEMPEDYKYKEVLTSQYLIACGVYALHNEKDDPIQRNVQAVQSVLRVYRIILKDHADAKLETLDSLSDDKKVEEYVKKQLEEEKGDNE